jgi:hypothetical protein
MTQFKEMADQCKNISAADLAGIVQKMLDPLPIVSGYHH